MDNPLAQDVEGGEDDLCDIRKSCRILGGSKPINPATLYRGVKQGRYPAPIKIGPQLSRWILSELLAVRTAAIQERDRNRPHEAELDPHEADAGQWHADPVARPAASDSDPPRSRAA